MPPAQSTPAITAFPASASASAGVVLQAPLTPYVQHTPALLSTSTVSTTSTTPSLCPPSLLAVRSHSALSVPLITPVDEAHDPMSTSPECAEKDAPKFRGRFVEIMEEDWEFRDEDAQPDESFEIVALPRASTSSEATTSTTQSETYRALPFIRRHSSRGSGISPSFSTSRLLASFGKKSRAIWDTYKDKPVDYSRPSLSPTAGGVAIDEEFGGQRQPLSSIPETATGFNGLHRQGQPKVDMRKEGTGNFLARRLSLRRRQP